jgi:hypothetical protein
MENLPYRLNEGLKLEQSDQIVPWFKSLNQITKRGGKPSPDKGKTQMLVWPSETVFNDISVFVKAMPRNSGIFLLTINHEADFRNAKEEYKYTVNLFTNKFGQPTEAGVEPEYHYPWCHWNWGAISLKVSITERFVDYVSIALTNEAP